MKTMADLKELMLSSPRLTLAVAESMTCGRVQARIGAISGASDFFLGGITAYAIDQKVKHLGVNRAAAKRVNSVSAQVAEQMARGACRLFGSDVGLGTTGYAEPSPAQGAPEAFAWWAIARRVGDDKFEVASGRTDCPGLTRTQAQDRVTDEVLAALLESLTSRSGS